MQLSKKFSKNDSGFVCVICGADVKVLGYTSRDHCNKCLCSLHIDINPGDRANTCGGVLVPVGVVEGGKKGRIINYKCNKCGKLHNNKAADDDCFEAILKIMSK
ncbi:MAG: RNHCP domain-containing protein [Firmicutes bacterium]|nr:RNHCP domain-containing protein [Bacillota bacterium]